MPVSRTRQHSGHCDRLDVSNLESRSMANGYNGYNNSIGHGGIAYVLPRSVAETYAVRVFVIA